MGDTERVKNRKNKGKGNAIGKRTHYNWQEL
jgi:hypothetical protein